MNTVSVSTHFRTVSRYLLILLIVISIVAGTQFNAAASENEAGTLHLTWGDFNPGETTPSDVMSAEWLADTNNRAAGDAYYIIQFNGPIHNQDKAQLAEIGVELLEYVPQFSYIARLNPAIEATVANYETVRWLGTYHPGFRIEPTLMATYQDTTQRSAAKDLIVMTFADVDASQVIASIENLGGLVVDSVSTEWKSKLQVRAHASLLPQIAALSGVSWVEEIPEWVTFNSSATDITNAQDVWTHPDLGLYGNGQVVAVADTGLDQGVTDPSMLHDDFEDGAGNSRVIAIHDRSGDGAIDMNWHGTHVAGIVAGNGAKSGSDPLNQDYVGSSAGVAPEASLVFQALARDDGMLVGIPFFLGYMFDEVYADAAVPAHIHSNSWGVPNSMGLYSSYARDVDEYMWNNPEFLVLFATGNEGLDRDGDGVIDDTSITSPATAKNSIAVGNSENSRPLHGTKADNINQLADNSGRGPTADGRNKPDLVAPGTVIESTAASPVYPVDYVYGSGTSMATPHVAGAAALVREYFVNSGHTPTASLLKAMLVNGAADIFDDPDTSALTARPDKHAGWGRVDLASTFGIDDSSTTLWWDNNAGTANMAQPIATGEEATYSVHVLDNSSALRVTLAWTDYPGSTIANGGLVNDLDIHVTAPDGTVFYPNNANSGDIKDSYDHVNNLVGVDIATPQLGEYIITVNGYNVPEGPQPYSLVVNGGFEATTTSGGSDGNGNGSQEVITISTQVIDGPGVYTFDDLGIKMEIIETTAPTATVRLIHTTPPHAEGDTYFVSRHYELVVAEGHTIVANMTFTYDQDEFDRTGVVMEESLNIHLYQHNLWSGYQPSRRDVNANTLTVNNIPVSGTSIWGFGPDVPTAVSFSTIGATQGHTALAQLLGAFFSVAVITTVALRANRCA